LPNSLMSSSMEAKN